jgi:lysine 2,3-aminomutase
MKSDKGNEKNKGTRNPSQADESGKRSQTRIIDDVFTDAVEVFKPRFEVDYEAYLNRLWEANSEIYSLLQSAPTLEEAREAMYSYLERAEREIFKVENDLHILEKATVRECIRAFKSIIGPVNEYRTEVSALDCLWKLARNKREDLTHEVSVGFLMEFINLFRGVAGRSNIYFESKEAKKGIPDFLRLEGREASEARTEILDEMGDNIQKYFKKYPSGLEPDVMRWRKANRERILRYFGAKEDDWDDYLWQIKHVIRDAKPLLDLIQLTADQQEAVKKATQNRIPFGITPYYLSLMDHNLAIGYDHAVRAQVIPPPEYV